MSRSAPSPHVSWPLTATEIAGALGEHIESVKVAWQTWHKDPSSTPLAVSWGPVPGVVDGSLVIPDDFGCTVWVGAVARERRGDVHAALLAKALPDLAAWVARALTATETWQAVRHERVWHMSGNALAAKDADGLHILDRERGR